MFRLIAGFVVGVFYGIIVVSEVPEGTLAKVGALIKMIFFS